MRKPTLRRTLTRNTGSQVVANDLAADAGLLLQAAQLQARMLGGKGTNVLHHLDLGAGTAIHGQRSGGSLGHKAAQQGGG